VLAQIRGIQTGVYLAIGWLAFCAALAAANWATITLDLMAHPIACLALMLVIVIMLPVILVRPDVAPPSQSCGTE
jgi:hypothetical protein